MGTPRRVGAECVGIVVVTERECGAGAKYLDEPTKNQGDAKKRQGPSGPTEQECVAHTGEEESCHRDYREYRAKVS